VERLIVGVDPEIGSSVVLRSCVAAGSATLLLAACVMVFVRARAKVADALKRSSFVALGAMLGAAMAWATLDRTAGGGYGADRRALEMRAEDLTAHSLAPGSALPCLDALVGEDVEAACEKSLFASPATVATATSYVAARLALLSDMVTYAKHGGGNIDGMLLPLRRSLEADRFGFLAYALAVRDGCTSQDCKALAVLDDASHVRSNLGAATLDRYLDSYLAAWAQPDNTAADVTPSPLAATAQPPHKMVNIDFPTAASIPAVSIMNPEPAPKVVPGAAVAPNLNPTARDAQPAVSQKRTRKQAASPATAPAPPAAVDAQVDPVWTPAPSPPQAAATAAGPAANVVSGPIQLAPATAPQ
jgi:hypothetical protein